MIRRVTPSLLQRAWPTGSEHLLLQALTAAPEAAEAAWRSWERRYDIEAMPWGTVRLLSAVHRRLRSLGIQPAHPGRLDGLRRFSWAHGQVVIRAALPVIGRFAASGIGCLLLKGGAAVAAGDTTPAERYLSDLDVLVRPADAEAAIDLLGAMGWQPTGGQNAGRLKVRELGRAHAAEFAGPGQGRIDLHWCMIHQMRVVGIDSAVWQGAVPARLLGQPVSVPGISHRLFHALVHGAMSRGDGVADWAADALACLGQGGIDWPLVVAEAGRRQVTLPVHATLAYLRDGLGLAVPEAALADLARVQPSRLLIRDFAVRAKPAAAYSRAERRVLPAAERQRQSGRDPVFATRWRRRSILLAGIVRALLPGRRTELSGLEAGPHSRLEIALPAAARPRAVFVRLAPVGGGRLSRVDLLLDGRWVGRWRFRGARWLGMDLRAVAADAAARPRLLALSSPESGKPAQSPGPAFRIQRLVLID